MMEHNFYTIIVYSENVVGVLNQVAAVFSRRQINIESLNASASSIRGVHKYTITCWCDEDQIEQLTKQIEKRIDVIKANYFVEQELFTHEVALYKISTPVLLDNPQLTTWIRKYDAVMMEVNQVYTTVLLTGLTQDILALYDKLDEFECLLQYSRTGPIAVTRSTEEPITAFLAQQETSAEK